MTQIFFSGDSEKMAQLLAFAKELGLDFEFMGDELVNPDDLPESLQLILKASSEQSSKGQFVEGSMRDVLGID